MPYGFKTADQLRKETQEARNRIAEPVRVAIEEAKNNGDYCKDFATHEIPLWLEETLKGVGYEVYYNHSNRMIVSWKEQ